MKFAVVVFAYVLAATSALPTFGVSYNPYKQQQSQTGYKPAFVAVPNPVAIARVVADARSANTLKYGNDVRPDGSFNYF